MCYSSVYLRAQIFWHINILCENKLFENIQVKAKKAFQKQISKLNATISAL